MRPAVFLDRDGTLIESVHYLNHPDQVRLISGAAESLNLLERAGYLRILVTNQSVIGKGLLTTEGLHEIQAELDRQLRAAGASLDAWYFCPEVGSSEDREAAEFRDRKPSPGMLIRAAAEHGVCLEQSWMVGDMVSDTLAGRNAGCKASVLVLSGLADQVTMAHSSVDYVVQTIADVGELILKEDRVPIREGL